MVDLSTKYMGLTLKNPLIAGSSGMVNSVENVRRLESAGISAVVLKSLFEEQIELESNKLIEHSPNTWHPEMFDYVSTIGKEFSEQQYLTLIKETKNAVSIPVIASLNCVSSSGWMEYAEKIQAAGADALELNIAFISNDPDRTAEDIESVYLKILQGVRRHITLPIAVKIGPVFTSMNRMATQLVWNGASALVLFNRFYIFDIDIEKLQTVPGKRFSTSDETHLPLRWIAMLSGDIKCDFCASTGIHTEEDVIKHILAGASAVQLCSSLYANGLGQINKILDGIQTWMTQNDFYAISKFKGRLSQVQSEKPESYERLQYIKALVGIE